MYEIHYLLAGKLETICTVWL